MVKLSRLLFVLALGLVFCRLACATESFAYLNCIDGAILQYRVLPDGKFQPLTPASIKLSTYARPLAVHHSKKFAYTAIDAFIYQFRISENGTLSLVKQYPVSIGGKPIECISFDSTGNYLYASLNDENGEIAGFKVSDNGAISPMKPFKLPVGGYPTVVRCHPTKPFVYVVNLSGSISQFSNDGGTLSPLKEPFADGGARPHDLIFSKDGKYAYAVSGDDPAVILYEVKEDGCLKDKGYQYYGIYSSSPILAIADSGSVFVADGGEKVIAEFKRVGKRIVRVNLYNVTRDNKFEMHRDLLDRAKEKVNAEMKSNASDKPLDKKTIEDKERKAYAEMRGMPRALAFGPNGRLYVVNSSGVAQFGVKEAVLPENPSVDSKVSSLTYFEPAIVWNDMLKSNEEYEAKHPNGFGPTDDIPIVHLPRGIVFVTR